MYKNIESCIKHEGKKSSFFNCNIGVRQGENLFPFLFAVFLNDLEEFFEQNNIQNLECITSTCNEALGEYIKLFVMLYADDTIIMSETKEGMQNALNVFEHYCQMWKLEVNVEKTKIIVFSKRKVKQNMNFHISGKSIEIVNSYTYLGTIFNYNGNFCSARKKIVDQAQKALFAMYRKIKNITLPVDLQLQLFDTLIVPILLYSSEVWGFENKYNIEKMHLQFCKNLLKVRNSTPNFMVYGELGRVPLEISIKLRMVTFWGKTLQKENKISNIMLRLMLKLHENNPSKFKWISYLKSIFDETGLSYLWTEQQNVDIDWLKLTVKQRLTDQFYQHWFSQIHNTSRGDFYSLFKKEFCLERYLLRLFPSERYFITKLRCSNLKLAIETGRWAGISREQRLCTLCGNGVGDEYHLLFTCVHPVVSELRSKFIPNYYKTNPNMNKFGGLLSICNVQVHKKLAIFLKKVMKYL